LFLVGEMKKAATEQKSTKKHLLLALIEKSTLQKSTLLAPYDFVLFEHAKSRQNQANKRLFIFNSFCFIFLVLAYHVGPLVFWHSLSSPCLAGWTLVFLSATKFAK
jgi:hypothetical protein